jgi:hypothetical protein
MRTNVGDTDKFTRTAAGAVAGAVSLAILAEAVSLPAVLSPVLGLAAAILLVTSYTGVCPLYSVLGVDTCSVAN